MQRTVGSDEHGTRLRLAGRRADRSAPCPSGSATGQVTRPIIRVSHSQADLTGAANPEETLGKTDFGYFTHAHAETAFENEREIPHRRADVCSKQPLRDFDGKIIGTFGISRDITARTRTEDQLRAKTAELDRIGTELRTLIESSPDPMCRFDRQLSYTYANPAALRRVLRAGVGAEVEHDLVPGGTRRFLHTRLVPE